MGGEVGSVSGESRGEGGEGPADEVKHDVQTTAGTSHLEKVKAVGWAHVNFWSEISSKHFGGILFP